MCSILIGSELYLLWVGVAKSFDLIVLLIFSQAVKPFLFFSRFPYYGFLTGSKCNLRRVSCSLIYAKLFWVISSVLMLLRTWLQVFTEIQVDIEIHKSLDVLQQLCLYSLLLQCYQKSILMFCSILVDLMLYLCS